MCNRYIVLLDHALDTPDPRLNELSDKLKILGLKAHPRINCAALFTTRQTPVLSLPSGGCLLGEVYDRKGRRKASPSDFLHTGSQQALRQYLLEYCWGEYLLIQPGEGKPGQAVTFMRDPSGGLGCTYSLKHGFVASDPALPFQLELCPSQVDWEFIHHCLTYSHAKISRTGIADIHELLPGCVLKMTSGSAHTQMAWSPWDFVSKANRIHDPNVAAQAVRNAITTTVKSMADTDESLVLQLSGGLDSSIVGVSLKGAHARISACTAISPLPGTDERAYAKQITDLLGVDLLEASLDFSQSGIQFPVSKTSLRPAVSPLAHMAAYAMNVAVGHSQVNAIYSGGGGDTVFSYLKTAAPAADAYLSAGLTAGWRTMIDLTKLHGCTLVKATRLTLRKLLLPEKPDYKQNSTFLRHVCPTPLERHPWFTTPPRYLPGDRERIFDLAGNQMFAEVMLRNDGQRVRMPLLSQPVMEACLRIPSWLWVSGGKNRAIARSAFSDLLPRDVLNRRSKGSFMNYNAALYRRNKETMRRFLLDGQLNGHGLLDPDQLNTFIDRPLSARDQSFLRIFDLCMIENWVRQH